MLKDSSAQLDTVKIRVEGVDGWAESIRVDVDPFFQNNDGRKSARPSRESLSKGELTPVSSTGEVASPFHVRPEVKVYGGKLRREDSTVYEPDPKHPNVDAFVSYAHLNEERTMEIFKGLEKAGMTLWLDKTDIKAGAVWRDEIRQGIESACNIIFLLSPEWVRSVECRKELDIAISLNKRLIPVLIANCEGVPDSLLTFQYIPITPTDDLDFGISLLIKAINTEKDIVRQHTSLLLKSQEWEESGREGSFLLQKKELEQAESWLSKAITKGPAPTPLQLEYLSVSRKHRTKAQARWQMMATIVVSVLVLLLAGAIAGAVVALKLKNDADNAQQQAVKSTEQALISAEEAKSQALIQTTLANAALAVSMAKSGDVLAVHIAAENYLLATTLNIPQTKVSAESALRKVLSEPLPTLLSTTTSLVVPIMHFFTFSPDSTWLFLHLQDLSSSFTAVWNFANVGSERPPMIPLELDPPSSSSPHAPLALASFSQLAISPDSTHFFILRTNCVTVPGNCSGETHVKGWTLANSSNVSYSGSWTTHRTIYASLIFGDVPSSSVALLALSDTASSHLEMFQWRPDPSTTNMALTPVVGVERLSKNALLHSCAESVVVIDADGADLVLYKLSHAMTNLEVRRGPVAGLTLNNATDFISNSRLSDDCSLLFSWFAYPTNFVVADLLLPPTGKSPLAIQTVLWPNVNDTQQVCNVVAPKTRLERWTIFIGKLVTESDPAPEKVTVDQISVINTTIYESLAGQGQYNDFFKQGDVVKHSGACNDPTTSTMQRQRAWFSQSVKPQQSWAGVMSRRSMVALQRFPTGIIGFPSSWSVLPLWGTTSLKGGLVSPSGHALVSFESATNNIMLWRLTSRPGPSVTMDKFGNFVDFPVAPTVMEDVAFASWGPSIDVNFHPSGRWMGYRSVEDRNIVEMYRLYTGAGGRTLTGPKITCHLTKNYTLNDHFRFGSVRDVAVVVFWKGVTNGLGPSVLSIPAPVNISWDILELTDTTCTVKHYITTGNCLNDAIAPAWGFADRRSVRFIANDMYIITSCFLLSVPTPSNNDDSRAVVDFRPLLFNCTKAPTFSAAFYDMSPDNKFMVLQTFNETHIFDLSSSQRKVSAQTTPVLEGVDLAPEEMEMRFCGFLPPSDCFDQSCFDYFAWFVYQNRRNIIIRCNTSESGSTCDMTLTERDFPEPFRILARDPVDSLTGSMLALQWSAQYWFYAFIDAGVVNVYRLGSNQSWTLHVENVDARVRFSYLPLSMRCLSKIPDTARLSGAFSRDLGSFVFRYSNYTLRVLALSNTSTSFDTIDYQVPVVHPQQIDPIFAKLWRAYIDKDKIMYQFGPGFYARQDLILVLNRNSTSLAHLACSRGKALTFQQRDYFFNGQLSNPWCEEFAV
mmetsp:Transcript_41224/g.68816  ORF Transcript_41224/g.68816 Transcript_41224/m.68816 type:complete len:1385 (-) Transcript_41224:87-4241(-)